MSCLVVVGYRASEYLQPFMAWMARALDGNGNGMDHVQHVA